ncbi:OmpA family protein [Roseovarius sp. MBR-51]
MAEAFILIAFALLLLFAFWQWEKEKENTPEVQAFKDMPYDQRQTVLTASQDGSIEAFMVLKENGVDFKTPSTVDEPKEKWRFIDQDEVRRLLDAASKFPEDIQRDLADMMESEEAQQILKEMGALEELVSSGKEIADLVASTEVAQAIDESGMSPQDLLATAGILKSLDESGRTFEEVVDALETLTALQEAGQTLEGIASKISQAEAQQKMMVGALRSELGEIVSSVGGQIDENGAIILPDTILFEQGQARITPVLEKFLAEACEPWVTTLKSSGVDIAEIKIEGHASSEWRSGSSPRQAYLGNLDLSQRRSQAVLRVCLDFIRNNRTLDWARAHMIAVGYSSVRPVMKDGEEDRAASRRVVLSAAPNRESLIDQIETEAKSVRGDSKQ